MRNELEILTGAVLDAVAEIQECDLAIRHATANRTVLDEAAWRIRLTLINAYGEGWESMEHKFQGKLKRNRDQWQRHLERIEAIEIEKDTVLAKYMAAQDALVAFSRKEDIE